MLIAKKHCMGKNPGFNIRVLFSHLQQPALGNQAIEEGEQYALHVRRRPQRQRQADGRRAGSSQVVRGVGKGVALLVLGQVSGPLPMQVC